MFHLFLPFDVQPRVTTEQFDQRLVGNAVFGVSSSLRHTCAVVFPGRIEYFRYDWKKVGLWNLLFVLGLLVDGFLASQYGGPHNVAISEAIRTDLAKLGMHDFLGWHRTNCSSGPPCFHSRDSC